MKPADLRAIVSWMTRGPWYPRGRFISLVPDNTGNHVATFAERVDVDSTAALRNHAEATCDVLDAVRDVLAASNTEDLYRCMDALRQAYARLEAVK